MSPGAIIASFLTLLRAVTCKLSEMRRFFLKRARRRKWDFFFWWRCEREQQLEEEWEKQRDGVDKEVRQHHSGVPERRGLFGVSMVTYSRRSLTPRWGRPVNSVVTEESGINTELDFYEGTEKRFRRRSHYHLLNLYVSPDTVCTTDLLFHEASWAHSRLVLF